MALAMLTIGAHQEGRLALRDPKATATVPAAAVDAKRSRVEGGADGSRPRTLTAGSAVGWGAQRGQDGGLDGGAADVTEGSPRPAPLWTQKELEEARAAGHAFPRIAHAHHLDEELYQQAVNIERTTAVEADLGRVATSLSLGAHFEGATCSDDLCRVVVVHAASEQRMNELNTLLGNGPLDGEVLMVPRPAPDNESILYFSRKGTHLPLGVRANPELAKQTYGTVGPDGSAPGAL